MIVIDPSSYEPVYRQLARFLKDAIRAGVYGPGQTLPSEQSLAQQYGIGRDTVRDALRALRSEGLIVTVKGAGSRVRREVEMDDVPTPAGARVTSRMPSSEERQKLGIAEGVPVLVVERPGHDPEVFPADRTALLTE